MRVRTSLLYISYAHKSIFLFILRNNIGKCKINQNIHPAFKTRRDILLNCVFSKYFINSLAKFLDKTYNKSQPEFIFMKTNFYSFNMHYDVFSDDDYLQLTLMILIAKERSLKINNDECLIRWNI